MWTKLLIITLMVAGGGSRYSENRFEDLAEFDAVAVTRCDIVCQHRIASDREQCHINCLATQGKKFGECPRSFAELTIFATACLATCSSDSECPGIEKCCVHSCGVTCQTATGLDLQDGLPSVPRNVTVKEMRGLSLVEIQWANFPEYQNKPILFVIETRHHFARFYRADSLGPWTAIHQTQKSPALIEGIILPARWYQFRVTAININGTKGFSKPSKPFSLSRPPRKPGRPRKLKVTHVKEVNGTVWGDLRWGKPKSDVPVRRYKIFWSRRLPGFQPTNASDSVLVHQRSLPKSQQHFQLKNLMHDELYFIQVQALAVLGRSKLKGSKAELFFNTTSFEDQTAEPIRRKRPG